MDTETFLQQVRMALTQWKQNQLKSSVQEDQDTQKLNLYLKRTAIAHEILSEYLRNATPVDKSLQDLVAVIGDPSSLTREQRMLLKDTLFRDLIEYPFTYNTKLINSFEQRNVLNTKIIPNK